MHGLVRCAAFGALGCVRRALCLCVGGWRPNWLRGPAPEAAHRVPEPRCWPACLQPVSFIRTPCFHRSHYTRRSAEVAVAGWLAGLESFRAMLVVAALLASGSLEPDGCKSGKFVDFAAVGTAGVCKDCPAGFWQALSNKPSCARCPTGHFQHKTGMHGCYTCPTGTFQDAQGSLSCKKCSSCQRGTISVSQTASKDASECQCNKCAEGRFAPAGYSACFSCQAGRFTAHAGSYSCYYCPTGHFQAQEGKTSCIQVKGFPDQ